MNLCNMNNFIGVCFLLLIIIFALLPAEGTQTTTTPSTQKQCQVWENISQELYSEETFRVSCHKKEKECDGFVCGGSFTYDGLFARFIPVRNIPLCFGVEMKHCENPPAVDLHIVLPHNGVHFDQRVHTNETVQVPGLHFNNSLGGIQGILVVNIERVPKENMVNLSVTFRIRLTALGREFFPQGLTRKIVPGIKIPVPPCPSATTTPAPITHMTSSRCLSILNNLKSTTTTAAPAPTSGKGKIGQQCRIDQHSCGNGEKCRDGVCECILDWNWDGQKCVGPPVIGPTKFPGTVTTASPGGVTKPHIAPNSATEKPGINSTVIAAVVGPLAFLLIVGIGVGIFCWYKRRDNPYAGRQLLLTSGDDDAGM
ncbi:uncharacterized protein LOC106167355 isoform X2 [Lingula anatina]|uniref:Uncharacterized protein LOC106167355 isoform X2 n=1 Tax=Lingula anatina TaxID=7574 RepID=A0A1S3ITM8_LINAN|nr:uncharacterized protein LOC106167355 isoform X2 [Lingula anatina]|eukprot:XP_013401565.1 uncharacterized protein LOC106167355 isoform X2 [Lingula anatina]